MTTGAAWSDQRRALALSLVFLLALLPALSPVFPAFFPALSLVFPALSLASQPRRTNAPHTEGCPSWDSIPTIT
jgi:hypothetical protein